MGRRTKRKELLSASDLARFCQVDLKTIHNWCDREEIRHFRTPGRHLRFRREDALDFLRRYGYPIPEELTAGRRRVMLLGGDAHAMSAVRAALTDAFEVTVHADAVDALVSIGNATPDAVIVDDTVGELDGVHIVQRLQDLERTRHVYLLFAGSPQRCAEARAAGAQACVDVSDARSVRVALDQALGSAV